MGRKGRQLEELVALVERAVGGQGVSVRSPAYLQGHDSGSQREVDVLLEANVGSTEIRVALECRDRDQVEDVRWLEQLATKRKDVRVQKMIAESSSAFSEGALNLARASDIEVRLVSEITEVDVQSWMNPVILLRNAVLEELGIALVDPSIPLPSGTPNEILFEVGPTRLASSAAQLFQKNWTTSPEVQKAIPPTGGSARVEVGFRSSFDFPVIWIRGEERIEVVVLVLRGTVTVTPTKAQEFRRYASMGGPIAETVTLRLPEGSVPKSITWVRAISTEANQSS